jgi:hypothetical protein
MFRVVGSKLQFLMFRVVGLRLQCLMFRVARVASMFRVVRLRLRCLMFRVVRLFSVVRLTRFKARRRRVGMRFQALLPSRWDTRVRLIKSPALRSANRPYGIWRVILEEMRCLFPGPLQYFALGSSKDEFAQQ